MCGVLKYRITHYFTDLIDVITKGTLNNISFRSGKAIKDRLPFNLLFIKHGNAYFYSHCFLAQGHVILISWVG